MLKNAPAMVPIWKALLDRGLSDDGQPFDWSAFAISDDRQVSQAWLVAKSAGIWTSDSLLLAARQCAQEWDLSLEYEAQISDGDRFSQGQKLVRLKSHPALLHAIERPLLNLASYSSGIATRTWDFVRAVEELSLSPTPRVCCTRKILPYYRELAHFSVRCGGGISHRPNLASGVLLKENHLRSAGSLTSAVALARREAPHTLRILVEVENLSEFQEAIRCKVEGVLIDDFSEADTREALKIKHQTASGLLVEVSGGITLENLKERVAAGVDVISIGSLTQNPARVDLSLLHDLPS